ncbi:MAG: hypothetical protein ACK4Z5_05820 [Brevundimonas sp.]
MTAPLVFVLVAYGAVVFVEAVRGAERMHRHPAGPRGFVADVALTSAWLAAFVAGASTVLAFAPAVDGFMGWLVPSAGGLAARLLFFALPPVQAARVRLRLMKSEKAV